MTPWLHIVGIGAEGLDGLVPTARAVVEAAQVIVGGERHHRLAEAVGAEQVAWPSPFDALVDLLKGCRGRRVVVLATGDPLWYSVGARIGRAIPPGEIVYHPQVSAFQLTAARMGWSMADLETLTAHGRPVAQVIPFIQPGARLLILTTGSGTPGEIAKLLNERGYGESRMTVFASMGGADECRFDGIAATWSAEPPAFNTLAVECVAGSDAQLAPRGPGLDDALFHHDGRMTRREVRAITMARLMPMRAALLWDIGAGCGSVAVEWMRAARDARAIGIEPRAARRALAAENAEALGAPRLRLVAGEAPTALEGLPAPDAVFIGGGLSEPVFAAAYAALPPLGRLVANATTLKSEKVLVALQARYGGDLARIAISRANPPAGRSAGWRPLCAVTQWGLVKR